MSILHIDMRNAVRGVVSDLSKRLGQPLQGELVLAQLTVAGVGGCEPVFEAVLVHHGQGPGAVTGRQ